MLAWLLAMMTVAAPAPGGCRAPMKRAAELVGTPGRPFAVVTSADGCWALVTLTGSGEVAAYERHGDRFEKRHVARIGGQLTGAVLTHDGKLLVVADFRRGEVVLVDVARLERGDKNPEVGEVGSGKLRGAVYVNVSPDDHYVFVSDEDMASVTVMDLRRGRREGFSDADIVNTIRTGRAPIALTFSPHGRYLYTTAEVALPRPGWPRRCQAEGRGGKRAAAVPEGAIFVLSVARAEAGAANAILATVPGGCSPVRLVLSPDGSTAYVTARGENAVYAFDTAKLRDGSGNPVLSRQGVGTSPVGIALVDGGRKLVVTNSDRFGANASARQQLTVLNADWKTWGTPGAVLGQVSTGAFPREMALLPGGNVLLVTDFLSRQLQAINLRRLPQ